MVATRSSIRRESEPWKCRDRDLAILADLAQRIRPETTALQAWFSTYFEQHRRRLAADLEIVCTHVAPMARVLEYGAIPLLMTGALAALDFDVRAVDIQPERFAAAIEALELEVIRCDVEIEPLPFARGEFDAVLFNEIFEHLRIDPIFTLREALRVLKPGGLLLLSTPNLRSFRGLRNLILHNRGHAVSAGVYEQYDKLEKLGHMGHVREYTTDEVVDFLGRIGFRVETLIYRGGHGRGVVGLAERLMPSMRPFFSVVARKPDTSDPGTADVPGTSER